MDPSPLYVERLESLLFMLAPHETDLQDPGERLDELAQKAGELNAEILRFQEWRDREVVAVRAQVEALVNLRNEPTALVRPLGLNRRGATKRDRTRIFHTSRDCGWGNSNHKLERMFLSEARAQGIRGCKSCSLSV